MDIVSSDDREAEIKGITSARVPSGQSIGWANSSRPLRKVACTGCMTTRHEMVTKPPTLLGSIRRESPRFNLSPGNRAGNQQNVILLFVRCDGSVRTSQPPTLSKFQIEAVHPDHFLLALLDLHPGQFCEVVKQQRLSLYNPPKTAPELLATLECQGLDHTVAKLRRFFTLL